jgi:hypothetical protein
MNKVNATIKKTTGVVGSVLRIAAVIFFVAILSAAYIIYKEARIGKESIKNNESVCSSIARGSNINEFISKAKESDIAYFPPSNIQPKHTFVFAGGFMQKAYCFVNTNGNTVVSTEYKVSVQ